jgi:hypothetical protein
LPGKRVRKDSRSRGVRGFKGKTDKEKQTIMKQDLNIEFLPYPEALLEAWENGDYSMLTNSKASDYIKNILISKARKRHGGRRFFGEAYIASKTEMVEGWYNSFKWLTSKKWITGNGLEDEFEKPFYEALMRHIGKDILKDLQAKAINLIKDRVHKKPVAPDLCLIDKDGRFKFIESKLPGDTINRRQIAGIALIKKCLGAVKPVSVSIVTLYPENFDPRNLFQEFYKLA